MPFSMNYPDFTKNRNVAANVIVSDGIYNSSTNPTYANYSFDAPLYTLLVGDTTQKKDLQIAKIYCNEISYLGNTSPLRVSVMAQYCQQENVKVSIWNKGNKLDEKNLQRSSKKMNYYLLTLSLTLSKSASKSMM